MALLEEGLARGDVAPDRDIELLTEIAVAAYLGIIINWVTLPDYPLRKRLRSSPIWRRSDHGEVAPQSGRALDEAGTVLRDPGRATLEPPQRARGVQERRRAGGARRAGRLPQPLDGRTPLPRGVLALLEPGDPVRAHRREDVAAATRLRRAPAAAAVQPPGAHGGVGRSARPALRRARRVRHRPLGDARRARGLRDRSEAHARDVAGGARAHRRMLDERRVLLPRHLLVDAAPACAAEAAPGPASADLGRDDQPRGPSQ